MTGVQTCALPISEIYTPGLRFNYGQTSVVVDGTTEFVTINGSTYGLAAVDGLATGREAVELVLPTGGVSVTVAVDSSSAADAWIRSGAGSDTIIGSDHDVDASDWFSVLLRQDVVDYQLANLNTLPVIEALASGWQVTAGMSNVDTLTEIGRAHV